MMPFLTEEVWQLLAKVGAEPRPAEPRQSRKRRVGERLHRAVADGRHGAAGRRRSKQQFADFQAVLGAVREIRQSPEHSAQGGARRSRSAATRRRPSCSSRCSRTSRRWPARPAPPGARTPTAPDVAASRHARRPARPDRSPRRREPLHRRRRRAQAARKRARQPRQADRRRSTASSPTRASSTKRPPKWSSSSATSWPNCAANWHRSKRRLTKLASSVVHRRVRRVIVVRSTMAIDELDARPRYVLRPLVGSRREL